MDPQKEQIAPEIIQALIAKATESGLTINDYLAQLLGLSNGHEEHLSSVALSPKEKAQDLVQWLRAHSIKGVVADDSRESIYTREDEAR